MRTEIEQIQDERDRSQTPSLAPDGTDAPSSVNAALRLPPDPAVPPVVRLGEDDFPDEDYADPQDTTPRPHIRVLGSPRISGREVEQVDDGTGAASGDHTSIDPDAKRAYDAAMALVNAHRNDEALDALTAFLVKWPDHPYADHAMYWRGECYYARGDYAAALTEFEGVVARFPAGAKAPDALLKSGLSELKLGHAAQGKVDFERLAKEYPQSDAVRRIPSKSHP